MTVYVETFEVLRSVYGIEKAEGGFKLWSGGCAIGTHETIEKARLDLHTHIRSRVTATVSNARKTLDEAEAALDRLGAEPFYLGRFLK